MPRFESVADRVFRVSGWAMRARAGVPVEGADRCSTVRSKVAAIPMLATAPFLQLKIPVQKIV